jgi:outer membrane immunogenic protein
MNRRVFWCIVAWLLIEGAGKTAAGQTAMSASSGVAQLEVTLAYSADRTNGVTGGCGCFWLNGGSAEANANFPHGMGVVSELAGHHGSNVNSTLNSLSLVSYLFGPRYTFRNRTRVAPFGQFLVGGVHGFDALFPAPGAYIANPDAFAFAAGGGLNLNLTNRIGLRAVQADYFQTHLPNDGNNRENHLRLSAGVVFLIGKTAR